MSLAGMANNYVLRTHPKAENAASTLGAQPAPDQVKELPHVPQGYTNQLIRWIPTESLSVYAALGALVGSTITTGESAAVFAAAGLLGIVYVWTTTILKKAADANIPDTQSKWGLFWNEKPIFEIVMSSAAFTLWVSALPDSWPTHLSWWKQEFGAAGVIVAAVVIPLIANISGKTPPAIEVSATD